MNDVIDKAQSQIDKGRQQRRALEYDNALDFCLKLIKSQEGEIERLNRERVEQSAQLQKYQEQWFIDQQRIADHMQRIRCLSETLRASGNDLSNAHVWSSHFNKGYVDQAVDRVRRCLTMFGWKGSDFHNDQQLNKGVKNETQGQNLQSVQQAREERGREESGQDLRHSPAHEKSCGNAGRTLVS